MEVYVEEAKTEQECLDKIYKKYGTEVNIIRRHVKSVPCLFGFFEKQRCEVSFSLAKPKMPFTFEGENKNYEKNAAFIEAHAKRIKEKIDVPFEPLQTKEVDGASSLSENSYEKLKTLVENIDAKLEGQIRVHVEHENIEKIKEILKDNDFSDEYIASLLENIKGKLTVSELENYPHLVREVLDYIASSIEVKPFTPISVKKIIAFAGPTGVGKTTSLVKLAALHFVHIQNVKRAKPQVHVITTDGYKIGAVNHIEKYCNCMDLSFSVADTVASLKENIDRNKERMDMIFIDSSGRNPNDKGQVAEVEKFLTCIDKELMEVHLVINAGTKMKDIELITEKYNVCKYDYVIISKLDETTDVGNVISVLAKKQVPISYVTVGQVVPTDITFEVKKTLLSKIRGLTQEAGYIEETYKCEDERFGDNIWLTKQKI